MDPLRENKEEVLPYLLTSLPRPSPIPAADKQKHPSKRKLCVIFEDKEEPTFKAFESQIQTKRRRIEDEGDRSGKDSDENLEEEDYGHPEDEVNFHLEQEHDNHPENDDGHPVVDHEGPAKDDGDDPPQDNDDGDSSSSLFLPLSGPPP